MILIALSTKPKIHFDLSKFTFDGWVDKCDKKRWTLSSGEKVRDLKVNQLEKADGKILSIIRYIIFV